MVTNRPPSNLLYSKRSRKSAHKLHNRNRCELQKIPGKLIGGTAPNAMASKASETASTPSFSRFHPVITPKANTWKPGPMNNFLKPSSSADFQWAGLPACRPGDIPWTKAPSIPWCDISVSCASAKPSSPLAGEATVQGLVEPPKLFARQRKLLQFATGRLAGSGAIIIFFKLKKVGS